MLVCLESPVVNTSLVDETKHWAFPYQDYVVIITLKSLHNKVTHSS